MLGVLSPTYSHLFWLQTQPAVKSVILYFTETLHPIETYRRENVLIPPIYVAETNRCYRLIFPCL